MLSVVGLDYENNRAGTQADGGMNFLGFIELACPHAGFTPMTGVGTRRLNCEMKRFPRRKCNFCAIQAY
jgi:hypothetical protein